jgi:hypothetical protein
MLQKPSQGYLVNDLGSTAPDFTTSVGITYYCSFRDITALSPIFYSYDIRIYEFAFFGDTSHVPSDVVIGLDSQIMATVRKVIADFLTVPGRVVGYRCDYSDGKQGSRRKRFDRSFDSFDAAGSGIERQSTELVEVVDGVVLTTYGAMFYRSDFKEKKLLQDYLVDPVKDILSK